MRKKAKQKPLSARAQRLIVRNDRIRKDFFALDKKDIKLQRILNDLGDDYSLDPDTIYLIVYRMGRYKI
jgi:hypothetical protein